MFPTPATRGARSEIIFIFISFVVVCDDGKVLLMAGARFARIAALLKNKLIN